MSVPERLKANAQRLVAPDETVLVAIPAQTRFDGKGHGRGGLVAYGFGQAVNPNRAIVVTERKILLCQGTPFSRANVKAVLREYPRTTRIGPPPKGRWYRTDAFGEPLYIAKLWFGLIEQARLAR